MKKLLRILKIAIISSLINQSLFGQILDHKMIQIISKKDTITFASLSNNFNTAKPTVIFIQGSQAIPIAIKENNELKILLPFKYEAFLNDFNFVIINRKGVQISAVFDSIENIQKNKSKEYKKNDNLLYRTYQAKTVLKYIRKQKWVDAKNIFVVGHSEGYRVAAKLSENNKFIKKLVCMSADPFNRITEEINSLHIENSILANDSLRVNRILNNVKDYQSIENIDDYKKNYELYNWASYEKNLPINSFEKYKNPLLIVYGSNDKKAFNNYLIPFVLDKKNVEIKIFPDLDHNYFRKEFDKERNPLEDSYHWDRVFSDILNWLLNE